MNFLQDLRIAVRRLRKTPGFTLVAVIVLAFGIGPNSAIFSIVNAVLLRPLPFRDPDRVVMVWETYLQKGFRIVPASGPNFDSWKEQNRVFENMGAGFMLPEYGFNITGRGEPERVQAVKLTWNYLSVLGIQPLIGRSFLPEEDRPGGVRAVVISNALWQRRFGSDPGVLGSGLGLDGQTYTVVGVLPPSMRSLGSFDVVLPLALGSDEQRSNHSYSVIARLKPGVTVQQATAEMETIAQRLAREYPETNSGWGASVTPAADILSGQIGPMLIILLSAVGFLLLIACANMASLLLARAADRRRDFAICVALGADRRRIIGELLAESLILSTSGGVLGLLLAYWTVGGLRNIVPDIIPRLKLMDIDIRVLGFTLAVSVATGLLFGLLPSVRAARIDLSETLKTGGRALGGGSSQRTRTVLLVAEVALALVLTVGAGLLAKSFIRLVSVDPGFRPDHLLTWTVDLPQAGYDGDTRRQAFYRALIGKLEQVPGVQSAAAISVLPMRGSLLSMRTFVWPFEIEGRPKPRRGEEPIADFRVVSAGFFKTMAVPLRSGRSLTEWDNDKSKPVVVVSEALVRRHFQGENPVGKRLSLGPGNPVVREIVGVAADLHLNGLGADPEPAMYVPHEQYGAKAMSIVIRTSLAPAVLGSAARQAVLGIDPQLPISNLKTMEKVMSDSLMPHWFSMYFIGAFATLALLLATVGIYGLTAYSVARRTHEIGLRMALGARPADVLQMVMRHGLVVALLGVACGLPLALGVSGALRGLLFGVQASDPSVFIIVSLLLMTAAALASFVPARRATRVDPLLSLRQE